MDLISFEFFAAVFAALVLYYLLPGRMQWPLLLLLSIGFLALNGSVRRMLLFFGVVAVAYLGARLADRFSDRRRSVVGLTTVAILVGMLFCAKDLSFVNIPINIVRLLAGKEGRVYTFPIIGLIGMSYFTLSLIGYVLDVCWGKYSPEKNYLKLILFAGYFPQLSSGPITRFDEMSATLFSGHTFSADRVIMGAERVMWGCFKKMVLADRAAIFVNGVYTAPDSVGLVWLVSLFVYALQLYADFSGCMDIILGISECFQIRLPENFNTPFASESLSEFWRRWHMTMGTWFKEYLLYPLMKTDTFQQINRTLRQKFGKKYGKKLATSLALSVLWVTIGIWHGGRPVFVLASGMIPGFFLVLEELTEEPIRKLLCRMKVNTNCLSWHLMRRLRVFLTMCCSWVFVGTGSISAGLRQLRSMFTCYNPWIFFDGTLNQWIDLYDWMILVLGLILLTAVGVCHEHGIHIRERFQEQNLVFRWAVLLAGLFTILIFGIYGPGYDAASFIYKQF